jgi:ribose transport system ATP-binding protein
VDENSVSGRGLTKSFGGTRALDDVSFTVRSGEILGLLGQNGSGKSTLVKILTGYHSADSGEVEAWGVKVATPIHDAPSHGIAVVHQDHNFVDSLSALDNIAVATRFNQRTLLPIRRRVLAAQISEALSNIGVQIDIESPVRLLSAVERSAVAIVRALIVLGQGHQRRLLILDEPTAALPETESRAALALLRRLADSGVAVIFISHHLDEVLAVCHRIMILRDGREVAAPPVSELTPHLAASLMLGREIESFYPDKSDERASGDMAIRVRNLRGATVQDVSFDVAAGEIVGVVGMAGMGQDEIATFIATGEPRLSGTIDYSVPDPAGAGSRRAGVGFVPANRLRDGIWSQATVQENLTLNNLATYRRWWGLSPKRERRDSIARLQAFGVIPPDPGMQVGHLSGGNQQKVVLARAVKAAHTALVLHEPTQGVDAGARRDLLEIIAQVAADGVAVLMFSTDIEQVASTCTRVIVLREGVIVGQLSGGEVDEARILGLSGIAEADSASPKAT